MTIFLIIAAALLIVAPALLLLVGRLVFRRMKWRPRFLGFPTEPPGAS